MIVCDALGNHYKRVPYDLNLKLLTMKLIKLRVYAIALFQRRKEKITIFVSIKICTNI